MDLAIVLDGWPFDEDEEGNNVRKVVGLDRRLKLQIRLRDGVIQWEVEGPPNGVLPHGCESVLAHCRNQVGEAAAEGPTGESSGFGLDEALLEELEAELLDYTRRRQAFLLIGDYSHALRDAVHVLDVLDFVRQWAGDYARVFRFERCRPQIVADHARAEALLAIQEGQPQRATLALSRGIEEVEEFFRSRDLEPRIPASRERRILVDFRRSLRERYNVPLTDAELLHTLTAEQRVAIEQEDYEMAARLRDKISRVRERMSDGH